MVEPDRPRDNIRVIRCMRFAWLLDVHSEYVILIAFPCNSVYAKVPQYYVYMYSTLHVLLLLLVLYEYLFHTSS